MLEKALSYLEQISLKIIQNPSAAQPSLVSKVCRLADRLKFYDPVGAEADESQINIGLDSSRLDNSWLKDINAIKNDFNVSKLNL